jgi:nucleoside-diphosphate-sugar epimerase
MASEQIVTITGISGYVGSQVCLYFLKNGSFKVRGTVRSTTNTAKIEPLKKAFGKYFDKLELVEADLLDEKSLQDAIKGSTYVVHTASPFPIAAPKDENVLIKPAVEGTLSVCRAAQKHKVKRLVITSSVLAIMVKSDKNKSHFTISDWSDLEATQPYEKSKTMAERAAWEFQKNLPGNEKFEIVTINPGFIMGPNLNEA